MGATRVEVVHDDSSWLLGPLCYAGRVRRTPVVVSEVSPADVWSRRQAMRRTLKITRAEAPKSAGTCTVRRTIGQYEEETGQLERRMRMVAESQQSDDDQR